MSRPTVFFTCFGDTALGRQRWLDPVLDAWPRPGDAPAVFASASEGRPLVAPDSPLPRDGVAFCVLESGIQVREARQLTDNLYELGLAGVLLAEDPGSLRQEIERDGVLVEPWDAQPAQLAAALHALCGRQRAVATLSQELRVARMAHGGLVGEMGRLHEELHLASTVQQQIIPRTLPDIEGVDLGVLYRPAGYVSGDIYDLARVGEHHLAFLVADAVGHGVPAALLTMVIAHGLVKADPTDQGARVLEPHEALSRLNQRMCQCQEAGSARFATAVYGLLDLRTYEVAISLAGHPPPMRVSPTRTARVDAPGPLLGVFNGAEYSTERFQLGDDETLVLYSDGFEVAFPPAEADGDRLNVPTREYLHHLAGLRGTSEHESVASALAALDELLAQQVGSLRQNDDVTALVIRPTRPAKTNPLPNDSDSREHRHDQDRSDGRHAA